MGPLAFVDLINSMHHVKYADSMMDIVQYERPSRMIDSAQYYHNVQDSAQYYHNVQERG
jgi:hypothetical protein